jgi:hypothetical protein
MLKFQMILMAVLIACFAFISCDRAQQVMTPGMMDTDSTSEEMKEGDMPPPEGDMPPPEGDMPPPEGDMPPPEGDMPPPEGDMPPPEGDMPPPEGNGAAQ